MNMGKDNFLKSLLSDKVNMTPKGFVAEQLSAAEFAECHELFFDQLLEISSSDISGIAGYGWLDEEGKTEFATCREFLTETFSEKREGYWFNWREMFETTVLDRDFFEKYYKEMEDRIHYCEGQRYLVYNNAYFKNMITDGRAVLGFPDWSKCGIFDCLVDIANMDLNKPYFKIPELFNEYCKSRDIIIPDFKERFLCMAYYRGIDTLRWHASIDDECSCKSIVKSISELKGRIYAL